MTTIKTEAQQAVEEITENLTNPGYFLSNRPFFYNANDYFASCCGQKTSKMLENEWLTVVIPSLKASNIKALSDAGVRLEKQWRLSRETRRQRSEDGDSVKMRKLMKSSLYQHRKAVLDHSGETMRDDLHALGPSLGPSLTQPWSSAYTPPYQPNPDSPELLTFSPPSPPELTARNETIDRQEAHAFFTSAGSLQDVLLSNLSEGHTLPQWAKSRPSYTFKLQLQDDWGSWVTELYESAKTKVHLNHNHIDEIALLSGILHLNKTHIGFSAKEIAKIHSDVLRTFYNKEMEDKDIERAQDAAAIWASWMQKWKSIVLKEKLAAESEGRDPEAVNAEPVVDAIMSSYSECKTKKIMPILFIALHVFRRYNNWAALTSESDRMMAVVGPILQEIMDIQHIIRFTCSNTPTSAGKHRKTKLQQEGQSRQPDIIGKTNEK
ncbi:hypothetical protein BGZ80_003082 [Entomortierella chlamydospora]|uniref:Uncharacterized protein n=1 Tax=Entomortierella chlamydospora TaxID=101097 RepID=A0A9P6SWP7_9FUNG|nr:hypothetical protein BGZ80_003082 [Entomortierella chlamydospora]